MVRLVILHFRATRPGFTTDDSKDLGLLRVVSAQIIRLKSEKGNV